MICWVVKGLPTNTPAIVGRLKNIMLFYNESLIALSN